MVSSVVDLSIAGLSEPITFFGAEITPWSIIVTILIIVIGLGIARFSRVLVTKYAGNKLPPDVRSNFAKVAYYAIIAITLLSALGSSGVDLSGLLLAGGFAGIVIGFATQSLFSNLISGIFLYVDKPMKIGDPVLITGKLPDVAGIVVEITPLSTRFRMFDGTYVRLPNTEVFSSEIRNFSGAAARRVEISIGVAYKENATAVIRVIKEVLDENPLVLVEPEPNIYVDNLGDSSVNINIWCWVPFSEWFPIRMQLVELVKAKLDEKGIEIPFPQRVVHFAQTESKIQNKSGKDIY